ncbi:MAG: HRDC domain-containing protein [Bacteroidales bacterium]|nr:HRDC domain-containing protein [Bacteroidales bacterium]
MNRFLRANRVASIEKQFCIQGESAFWTFCVTCADGPLKPPQSESERRERIDYREVLDADTFAVFSRLRVIRKQMAEEGAVPAYAVFTDAELAAIAQAQPVSEQNIQQLNGVGEKRMEKYGRELVRRYNEQTIPQP